MVIQKYLMAPTPFMSAITRVSPGFNSTSSAFPPVLSQEDTRLVVTPLVSTEIPDKKVLSCAEDAGVELTRRRLLRNSREGLCSLHRGPVVRLYRPTA